MSRLSRFRSFCCVAFLIGLPLALPAATRAAQPHAFVAPAPPAAALMDINTATLDQLKTLPGIGDAYAKRIIAGQPFTAKNQLVTRGIIPQATYSKIADRIIAHRPR